MASCCATVTAVMQSVSSILSLFVGAWLEVIDMEQQLGDVQKASILHSQAIKTLEPAAVQQFIRLSVLTSCEGVE